MARRKQRGFELIASAPWPIGAVLGIVAYAGVRYGIPWYLASSNNMFLAPMGNAMNGGATTILAWTLLGLCWAAAFASFIGRRQRSRLLETQTGLGSLRAMSWRQFEMLVGEAFRRQGYRIEETGLGGADGGIDLRLSKDSKTTLVQCKQWRNRRVDVKVVREMYGLLAHHHADAVTIVAIGDFTPDAGRFAHGKPIELIHGEALLAMIHDVQTLPRPAGNPIPASVAPATATPDCPKCGAPMVKRTNHHSHEAFWGRPKYPQCRGTRQACAPHHIKGLIAATSFPGSHKLRPSSKVDSDPCFSAANARTRCSIRIRPTWRSHPPPKRERQPTAEFCTKPSPKKT